MGLNSLKNIRLIFIQAIKHIIQICLNLFSIEKEIKILKIGLRINIRESFSYWLV
jgi:hypothetical protein